MELRSGRYVDDAASADFATCHGMRRLALYDSVLAGEVKSVAQYRAGDAGRQVSCDRQRGAGHG